MLHVDLDQFIAAVEMLRRPEFEGLAIVVGGRGDPTERGVVSTASYAARAYGVGSGMPLRVAARKCPHAVFLPVDHPAYDEASRHVMDTLRSLTWGGVPVLLEVLGWDEVFLGAGPGHADLGVPEEYAATEFGKPHGDFRLTGANWFEVMGERPTRALWGIGAKTSQKLVALGIETVRQLAGSDVHRLAAELGPTMGPWYHRLGRGVDPSPVDPAPYVPRAHGRETTFQADLEDPAAVEAEIRRLTRPTVLADAALSLLERIDRTRAVRLLGVRLEMAEPTSTVEPGEPVR